jgi:hypothetical protein
MARKQPTNRPEVQVEEVPVPNAEERLRRAYDLILRAGGRSRDQEEVQLQGIIDEEQGDGESEP